MKIYAWWAGLTFKKDVFILQIISCHINPPHSNYKWKHLYPIIRMLIFQKIFDFPHSVFKVKMQVFLLEYRVKKKKIV